MTVKLHAVRISFYPTNQVRMSSLKSKGRERYSRMLGRLTLERKECAKVGGIRAASKSASEKRDCLLVDDSDCFVSGMRDSMLSTRRLKVFIDSSR